MSFFGADPSSIIAQIGSAFQSLAPAPAVQGGFAPGQGPGGAAFAPAQAVGGPATWPTVTMGQQGGFQPAQMNPGTFNPSGGFGQSFQPADIGGSPFSPSGGLGGGGFVPSYGNPLLAPPKAAAVTSGTTTPASGTATYTGLDPQVGRWAGQAQSTFADLGDYVPDAMLAIIQHESSGSPTAYNAAGDAWGLFQQLHLNSNDPNAQFSAAHQLAVEKLQMIDASYAHLGLNPDARTRARDLFLAWAGQFDPATAGPSQARDITSGENGDQFLNGPRGIMPMYDNIVRGKQQGGTSIPADPALQTLFGGATPPVMQEFGVTDYSQGHPDTYAYGNAYGLAGSQHPGVDYGMPLGTRLYVPVGGTVSVVGNDHGSGYYYTSTMTQGDPDRSGELAITLDNGDIVILGHMGSINLQVGQRVNAGDFAGLSGGSDGAHLHLEVRQAHAPTSSGYQIVDPRIYFGQR